MPWPRKDNLPLPLPRIKGIGSVNGVLYGRVNGGLTGAGGEGLALKGKELLPFHRWESKAEITAALLAVPCTLEQFLIRSLLAAS